MKNYKKKIETHDKRPSLEKNGSERMKEPENQEEHVGNLRKT